MIFRSALFWRGCRSQCVRGQHSHPRQGWRRLWQGCKKSKLGDQSHEPPVETPQLSRAQSPRSPKCGSRPNPNLMLHTALPELVQGTRAQGQDVFDVSGSETLRQPEAPRLVCFHSCSSCAWGPRVVPAENHCGQPKVPRWQLRWARSSHALLSFRRFGI